MPASSYGYREAAQALARYLASRQREDGSFPGRSFYGETFALWLWSFFGEEFRPAMERAISCYLARDKRERRLYWEFNNYALLNYRARTGDERVSPLLRRLRFTGKSSANWSLLRAACRLLQGGWLNRQRAAWGIERVMLAHAREGLILDAPGVRSLQYHAFSGALLAEMAKAPRPLAGAATGALLAAEFIEPLVFSNGDALYLGRGQEQIFGQGALIFLLEAAHAMTGEERYRRAAASAFSHLLRFQREDGSFPLVLWEGEPRDPWEPEVRPPGWYRYNRYADYLPLLGVFLMKAAEAAPCPPPRRLPLRPEPHPGLLLVRKPGYVAALACPGGHPANDLPFPYVCREGESLFPCYGGENPAGPALPLPFGLMSGGRPFFFRERLRYRLEGTNLLGDSWRLKHRRRFEFRDAEFLLEDEIVFNRRMRFTAFHPLNFLLLNARQLEGKLFETRRGQARALLEFSHPCARVEENLTCARGRLVAIRETLEEPGFAAGEKVRRQVWVRFR
jgi:hypothetical protein